MTMHSFQLSLSEPLDSYMESRLATGEYATPAEYVRDLIRQDRERKALRLEAELQEALASPHFEIDIETLREDSLLDQLDAGRG